MMESSREFGLPRLDGKRSALLAGAVVVALAAANLLLRALFSGSKLPAMGDDLLHYYYPSYIAIFRHMAEGSFAIWNPYQLAGVPWLAALQTGVFYPPHALHFFLHPAWAIGASALLHLAVAALACLVLARRLGLQWLPALLFGLLFTSRGYFPGLVAFPNLFEVTAWLPLGCLAVVGLARGSYLGGVAGLGFCTGMSLLAGYPQSTVYEVYLWGALLLLMLVHERRSARESAIAIGCLFVSVALGAAIAGVMLLPAYEVSREGSKDLESLDKRGMYPIRDDLQNSFFGSLLRHIGAAGLSLIAAGLFLGRRRGLALIFLLLGALTLAFSMGPRTPLFELYLLLPPLDSFRFPHRIKFVPHFCFAFAAAVGLDAIMRSLGARDDGGGKGSAPSWLATLASAGVAFLLLLWLANSFRPHLSLYVAGIGALVAVAAWWGRMKSGSEAGRAAVVGLAVAVLALVLVEIWTSPPIRQRIFYTDSAARRVYHRPTPITDFLAGQEERTWIHSLGLYPTYPLKMASVYRFRGVGDYEPANLKRQAQYFRYLMKGPEGLERQRFPYTGGVILAGPRTDPAALGERRRLLDLVAARYLLADKNWKQNELLQRYLKETGHRVLMRDEHRGTLFENPNALPRAYTTYRVEEAPDDIAELLGLLARDEFDPRVLSYSEGDPGFAPAPGAPRRGRRARILVDEASVVEVEARMKAPGMLVLADTYHSGWRATVDGDEVQIRPVNHLFRGVPVEEGVHRVRFEYRPRSLLAGAVASGTGAAICAALAILHYRQKRSHGESPGG